MEFPSLIKLKACHCILICGTFLLESGYVGHYFLKTLYSVGYSFWKSFQCYGSVG